MNIFGCPSGPPPTRPRSTISTTPRPHLPLHSPPSQVALRPNTNRTGSSATIPIPAGALGCIPRSICVNRALSYACGFGFCEVDQVVGMLGDWRSSGTAEGVGCLAGIGGGGEGMEATVRAKR